MASGHNDPKLLYAINGVEAFHMVDGKEESLTPSGPQTLSLLMVPTSSLFADPATTEPGALTEEDFYLHLHLPPELDLPLPATTQIYHKPPTSYLIPRWDMGPDSGAFTRIQFPSPGSRKGIQEDVDTFETILAQCTSFLERAPPPTAASTAPSAAAKAKAAEHLASSSASSSKARSATSEQLPAYNPAEFKPGEAYATGSHSSHHGGQIVLVDEEDGSVIGELGEGFDIVEDDALKAGSKDPVEITLPADGSHNISVQPASQQYVEMEMHPAYKKSSLVSHASLASRLIVTTSDMVSKALQGGADTITTKTKPCAEPVTFKLSTHEHVRRINQLSTSAAGLSSNTVGKIGHLAQNLGATLSRKKEGTRKGFEPDGAPSDKYKPGLLNKSLMAFSTIADGIDQAGRNLLTSTSSAATTVVTHKWGPEAGELSKGVGGGFKNVGLVYIDVTGVSRKAVVKSVAKGMVVGKVKGGGQVIVGGGDGGMQPELFLSDKPGQAFVLFSLLPNQLKPILNSVHFLPRPFDTKRHKTTQRTRSLQAESRRAVSTKIPTNNHAPPSTINAHLAKLHHRGWIFANVLQVFKYFFSPPETVPTAVDIGEVHHGCRCQQTQRQLNAAATSRAIGAFPPRGALAKMLHEILLSLSGHPSPLLRTAEASDANAASTAATSSPTTTLSPPERNLLSSAARLSDLHVKLLNYTGQISAQHPSTICRAVATSIDSAHLAAFRKKVLDVESDILKGESSLVGAYNIVPLTAVIGEFSDWTRRLEWLWEIVQFMLKGQGGKPNCTGAMLINRLRDELQTGYADIEATAVSLVRVAETAWLKQVSAWILYGRLPSFGGDDFFIKSATTGGSTGGGGGGEQQSEQEFAVEASLLPSFVAFSTASSMLFIGRSLTYIRARSTVDSNMHGLDHLSSQLGALSKLTYPLSSAAFARTITSIRLALSRNTLQKLLPLTKVVDILQLLRGFFLLGRGEFAMILTHQADEKLQARWKRAERLAQHHDFGKRDNNLAPPAVKEGEVSAVLARTWAAMTTLQGQHAEEDEGLELARDLLRLTLSKNKGGVGGTPLKLGASVRGARPPPGVRQHYSSSTIAATPFRNLLFSVPVVLNLEIPSPIDLFLTKTDLQTYSAINAYLLSLRRAHIRLTDLWKITALRRHYPAPPAPPYGSTPAGRSRAKVLRERQRERAGVMRAAWATASAAVFFLAETEAYLQNEVVDGLWDGFQAWLTAGVNKPKSTTATTRPVSRISTRQGGGSRPTTSGGESVKWHDDDDHGGEEEGEEEEEEEEGGGGGGGGGGGEGGSGDKERQQPAHHDPQTLALAHKMYLRALAHHLLLTNAGVTESLYSLLVRVDQLTARVRLLQDIWNRMDLEADEGVIDTRSVGDEETDVRQQLVETGEGVRDGIQDVISSLRNVVGESAWGGDDAGLSRRRKKDTLVGGGAGSGDGEGEEDDDEIDGVGVVGGEDEGRTLPEEGEYVPRRVGGIDRLLMKLDFGGWFDSKKDAAGGGFYDDHLGGSGY
ncbi:Spc97/Spc98 family protein [Zalerion maritima]|uniref:Spc97/Spc98 family protein n=1 Tax=Zalerion maritima TaxID=339359 RepID=A0AAD5WTH2_9PEZI|nr:Spc97/Spc98 family protein [Zalerion maritima]